jgi:hypothetical protein
MPSYDQVAALQIEKHWTHHRALEELTILVSPRSGRNTFSNSIMDPQIAALQQQLLLQQALQTAVMQVQQAKLWHEELDLCEKIIMCLLTNKLMTSTGTPHLT